MFKFGSGDIQNFTDFKVDDDQLGLSGFDVAAVKVAKVKGETEAVDGALTQLSAQEVEVDTEAQMVGYPEQSIEELEGGTHKYNPEGHTLFFMEGKIEHVTDANNGGKAVCFSMDASKG